MVYSCAIWRGGEKKTLEEAQEEKLETVARKLDAEGGRPGPRRRLRLGRLPALGGDQARRQRRRHHPLPAPGREGAAAGRGGRRRRPGRDPGHGLPRPAGDRREVRRDRQHRHGRARRRLPDRGLRPDAGADAGAGRAPAQPRHHPPAPQRRRGRRLLRALRLPRCGAAAPLAQPAGAGTGRLRHPPRRGLRPRLRRDPAPLGPAASTTTSTRRSGSPAPNGCGSGASTCGRRATASRSGFTSIYQARCSLG